MRMMLLALLVGLPILAMWQGGPLIKRTNPSTLSTPTGYTHVVEVTGPGKMIYIAGQVAFDASGKVVGAGDMKAQTEQVFKNLEAALKTAGATFADVVKMNTYVTDMSQVAAHSGSPRTVLRRHDASQHARAGQRPGATGTGDRDRSHRRRSGRLGSFQSFFCASATQPRSRSPSRQNSTKRRVLVTSAGRVAAPLVDLTEQVEAADVGVHREQSLVARLQALEQSCRVVVALALMLASAAASHSSPCDDGGPRRGP